MKPYLPRPPHWTNGQATAPRSGGDDLSEFRLVLAWLRIILRVILLALLQTFTIRPALKPAS
jgi:hypothetical protein